MCVIIHNPYIFYPCLGIKTSLGSVEACKTFCRFFHVKAAGYACNDCRKSIKDIVTAWNIKLDSSKHRTVLNNIKRRSFTFCFYVRCLIVGVMVYCIGYNVTVCLSRNVSDIFIIKADDSTSGFLINIFNKLTKSLPYVFHRTVVVKMVILNICNHRNPRMKLQKRAVALVRLRYKPAALFSKACISLQIIDLASDDNRRVYSPILQNYSCHRSRRCLSVCPRDSNSLG